MHRALVQHPVLQLQVRASRLGTRVGRSHPRAGRERDAEQVPRELDDPAAEIRCRAVNVTTAACNRGPNADADQLGNPGAGLRAAVRQRNWWVRCSLKITLIGGNSET